MKALRIISLVLVLVMLASLFVACNSDEEPTPSETQKPTETETPTSKPTSKPTEKPTEDNEDDDNNTQDPSGDDNTTEEEEEEEIYFYDGGISIDGVDISEFVIVYAANAANTVKGAAEDIQTWIYDAAGVEIDIVDDSTAEAENEILVGNTNRSAYNMTVANDTQYNYKVAIKNGKLAVAANKRNGWKTALAAIMCTCAKNEGDMIETELTNSKISYNDMKDLISGAVRFDVLNDGLRAWRSTALQQEKWSVHTANWSSNKTCPESAALIYFDFDTNSSFVNLAVQGGNITVLINDKFVVKDVSAYTNIQLDNGNGLKNNHITVILPTGNSNNWKVTELEVADDAYIAKHETDLNVLILGDSITEGYNNHGNPHLTYTFTVKQLLNANVLNQGYSGSQIWVDMLDPAVAEAFQPDLIIIALGTNDYANGNGASSLKTRMNSYLDKLEEIYPDVPIVGLTPIARLNREMTQFDSNLKNASQGLIEAFEAHGALAVDAEDFCEHNVNYYADYVHPNEYGFPVYGKHICDAIESLVDKIVKAKNS